MNARGRQVCLRQVLRVLGPQGNYSVGHQTWASEIAQDNAGAGPSLLCSMPSSPLVRDASVLMLWGVLRYSTGFKYSCRHTIRHSVQMWQAVPGDIHWWHTNGINALWIRNQSVQVREGTWISSSAMDWLRVNISRIS